MSRIFFVALLVVCFVYVLQATPVPDQAEQQPNVIGSTVDALNQTAQVIGQKLNEFITSDDVKKAGDAIEGILKKAQKDITEGVANFISKTEGSEAGKQ